MSETPGRLFVVATPIGNLEDITLRALRTLREADLIAAEDTRVTRKLLSHYDIHTPTIAYHQHSGGKRAAEILSRIVSGENVAMVSDAGTPGVSDPGHELIRLAIDAEVEVVMIPGATAMIVGLVASGLPCAHFAFDGFPPRKESERRAFFEGLKSDARTTILYESPLRLMGTLKSALSALGDRRVAVVREATKLFEEVFRGTISEAIARFTHPKPRGEIVLIIEGAAAEEIVSIEGAGESVVECLHRLRESGMTERDAIREAAAELKLPRREVYAVAIRTKRRTESGD